MAAGTVTAERPRPTATSAAWAVPWSTAALLARTFLSRRSSTRGAATRRRRFSGAWSASASTPSTSTSSIGRRVADVGVGGDAARIWTRVCALDRGLELRRVRPGRRAGGRRGATGHQPGPVQPLCVPPGAAGGVRAPWRGAGGLQPARHRPPSRRPAGGRHRRAPGTHASPGPDPLVAPARPVVLPKSTHRERIEQTRRSSTSSSRRRTLGRWTGSTAPAAPPRPRAALVVSQQGRGLGLACAAEGARVVVADLSETDADRGMSERMGTSAGRG